MEQKQQKLAEPRRELQRMEVDVALAESLQGPTIHGIMPAAEDSEGTTHTQPQLGPTLTAALEVEGLPVEALDTGSPVTSGVGGEVAWL